MQLEPVPQPQGMSEAARLAGVFFEPAKTFEDVAERPNFWVPLILVTAVTLLFAVLFAQHVGFERMLRHQFEMSSRTAQLTPEQREMQLQMALKFTPPMFFGGILLGVPIGNLVWAAILLGIVKGMMSVPVRLKQIYAIVCYAGLPTLIMTVLTMAVMFLKSPDDFNIQNPLVFNPGAFMDPTTTSKFVYSLASSLDLFRFWVMALVGIGLKAAGGRNLSMGGAMTAVFLPWAIWTLVVAFFAGLFS